MVKCGVEGGVNAEMDGPKMSQGTHGHVLPQPLFPLPPHSLQLCDGGVVAQHLAQHAHALGAKVVAGEAV